MNLNEQEMREALFGVRRSAVPSEVQTNTAKHSSIPAAKRKSNRNFVPRFIVTLRVGNEFEGATELFIQSADTLSRLQAELDAMKEARKKYKYIELVSVEPEK